MAYAFQGRRDDAIRQVELARARLPLEWDSLAAAGVVDRAAEVYTVLGDTAAAVSMLDRLLSIGSMVSVHDIETDPTWDPLRGAPEFREMMQAHAR